MNYNREPDRQIYIQQASHMIAFSYELKRRICIYKNYTVQIQILKINCFIEVIITIIIKRISRARPCTAQGGSTGRFVGVSTR